MQQVHQGVTRSGIPGLFTGNFLAWGLRYDTQAVWNSMSHDQRVAYCKRLGFELIGKTTEV